MDKKTARKIMANADAGKKPGGRGKRTVAEQKYGSNHSWSQGVNRKEESIVNALDSKRMLEKYAPLLEKLADQKVGVDQFLQDVSPALVAQLLNVAMTDFDGRNRLSALKDLLDRAGYGATKRVSVGIGVIDPNAPRAQLEAQVLGLASKTRALEIEEDDVTDVEPEDSFEA